VGLCNFNKKGCLLDTANLHKSGNSKVTIERTLNALVKEGFLLKISSGRTASYAKAQKDAK